MWDGLGSGRWTLVELGGADGITLRIFYETQLQEEEAIKVVLTP